MGDSNDSSNNNNNNNDNITDVECGFTPSEETLTRALFNIPSSLLHATHRAVDPTVSVTTIYNVVIATRDFGVDLFVRKLQEETIHESCSWLDIGANKELLEDLAGALSQNIKDSGIEKFVLAMPVEILRRYCADMGIDNEDVSKNDVDEQIKEEVMLLGIEHLLGKLTVSMLKDLYEALHVATGKVPTGMKKEGIIESLVLRLYSDLPSASSTMLVKQEVASTPKRGTALSSVDITNSTKKDLEQMYVKDLRDYLKQQGLKNDDKKSVLVSRVLRHLKSSEADRTSEPPTPLLDNEGDNTTTSTTTTTTTTSTTSLEENSHTNSSSNINNNNNNNSNSNSNNSNSNSNSTTNNNNATTNGVATPARKTKRRKADPAYKGAVDEEGSDSEDELTKSSKKKKPRVVN